MSAEVGKLIVLRGEPREPRQLLSRVRCPWPAWGMDWEDWVAVTGVQLRLDDEDLTVLLFGCDGEVLREMRLPNVELSRAAAEVLGAS